MNPPLGKAAEMLSKICGRATCWSITINNPEEEDYKLALPPGWRLEGQLEKGENTETIHFQGMLKTPQVRFSAVKRHFPRAHIEIARDKQALEAYVHKDDTRVAEVASVQGTTVFQLQKDVCGKWDENMFEEYLKMCKYDYNEAHLKYSDYIVRQLIQDGREGGIEYVAINPMWRSSWKLFGAAIVDRFKKSNPTV